MNSYFVYILSNKKRGTLYIGLTNNLLRRLYEHKNGLIDGFTKRYNIKMLVYFETTSNIQAAIEREKKLKKWNRAWKINIIEKNNPEWKDLSENL